MNRIHRVLVASTCVLALAACSSSSESEPTDTSAAPTTTDNSTVPDDEPVRISVTVGEDDFASTNGESGTFELALGTAVEISLTNPSADDEFHLHGYDLEAITAKGETGKIALNLDQAGEFDVESHVSEQVVARIIVK